MTENTIAIAVMIVGVVWAVAWAWRGHKPK